MSESAKPTRSHRLIRAITHRKLLAAASCVAVLLLVFSAIQLGTRVVKTTGKGQLPDPAATIVHDADQPEEKKPAYADYTVPADQPRLIKLPTLDITGPIQKVGLTKGNAVAVPTNVYFAGWYTGSVKPGYPGLSIIDAHVSGKYAPGLFKQLTKLKVGEKFEVTYGDGSARTFAMVEGKTLPEKEAAMYLFAKRQDIDRQLNLITCDGVYDRTTKQYDKRYIVVARAVDD